MYAIFQKQGVQGFKISYWLSSFDDKDKDKDMVKMDMVDMDMVDMDMMVMDMDMDMMVMDMVFRSILRGHRSSHSLKI